MKNQKIKHTILAIGIFFSAAYILVFYSHRYNFDNNVMYNVALYMGFIISFVLFWSSWFKIIKTPRWLNLLQSLLIAGVMLAIIFSLYFLRSKYFEFELNKYGVNVKASVIGFTKSTTGNKPHRYAVLDYSLDNKHYTQKASNDDDFFRINDSLSIVCSSQDPEIFRLVSDKHLFDKTIYRFKY